LNTLSVETLIAVNLLYNEDYARGVSPYLKLEFFEERPVRILYDEYDKYLKKYNALPTKEALYLEVETRNDLDQSDIDSVQSKLSEISQYKKEEKPDQVWLLETTENYCKDRALYLAITDSISILDGGDESRDKNIIPDLLSDALAVSFDEYIGHEFLEQAGDRWDFMHKKEKRLTFDLDWFNKITNGGIPKKTLSIFLAPTNAGKTLVKCHLAASYLMRGYNVLYITMEMAEERISERIDANLMDIDINDLAAMPRDIYEKRITNLQQKTPGRLFVKEFPTAGAHAGHFRHLLRELELKKKFKADVVFIDYLNICTSSRIKNGENTYVLIKSIAEELRGLAVEKDIAIISSTQTNRDGWGASDLELSNTSESAGLPATADLMIGIIVTEQLNAMGQIMFKQLKNRFTDVTRYIKTVMGIDRPKMKLFEIEQNGADVVNNGSVSKQIGTGEKVNKDTGEITGGTPPWEFKTPAKKEDPFSNFQM